MPRGAPDWFYGTAQKDLLQLLREAKGFGRDATQLGGGGQYSQAQLWNPIGSLVDAIVYRIDFMAPSATSGVVFASASKYATDAGAGICRYMGQPVSELHVYTRLTNDVPADLIARGPMVADVVGHIFPCYICVPPNEGVTISCDAQAIDLKCVFWWFEYVVL